MDMIEVSAKTVSDAITEACQKLGVTSDKLDYRCNQGCSKEKLCRRSCQSIFK